MTTRSEFMEWKSHPVTKQVFQELAHKEEDCKNILSVSAGINATEDRFFCGYIAALRDFYLIDVGDAE
jgi:hypothetical protein